MTSIRPALIGAATVREQLGGRALLDRPAGLDPDHPLRHPPRLREVVRDEDEVETEPLAELQQRLLDAHGRLGSSAEVGSSRSSTRGSSASARASIARCCSPTESFDASRSAKRGVEPGEARAAARCPARVPASAAAKRRLSLDRALEQRRQLRDEHDLAPQLQRIALADVGAPVAHGARVGVREPVEQPQQGRLARARGAGDAGRAGGDPGAEPAQHQLAGARQGDALELETRLDRSILRLSDPSGRRASRCRADLEPMLATPAAEPPDGRRLGVRDQVGRDPRARLRRRRGVLKLSRAARRPTTRRAIPSWRRSADALGGRDAILDGEIVAFDDDGRPSFQLLQRRMGLANEATIRRRAAETPGDLRRLRPALARRRARCSPSRTSAGASCSPASGSTARTGGRRAHHVGDGARALDAGPGPRPRGDRRQAARLALPARQAQPRVGEGPQPPRPGARDRRLDARRGQSRRPRRLAAGGPLRRRASSSTPAASAPASRRTMLDELTELLEPLRAARLAVRARRGPEGQVRASEPATAARGRSGSSPSSSPRSSSPSGPTRARCASPRSRACATTRTRARSCGSRAMISASPESVCRQEFLRPTD